MHNLFQTLIHQTFDSNFSSDEDSILTDVLTKSPSQKPWRISDEVAANLPNRRSIVLPKFIKPESNLANTTVKSVCFTSDESDNSYLIHGGRTTLQARVNQKGQSIISEQEKEKKQLEASPSKLVNLTTSTFGRKFSACSSHSTSGKFNISHLKTLISSPHFGTDIEPLGEV